MLLSMVCSHYLFCAHYVYLGVLDDPICRAAEEAPIPPRAAGAYLLKIQIWASGNRYSRIEVLMFDCV